MFMLILMVMVLVMVFFFFLGRPFLSNPFLSLSFPVLQRWNEGLLGGNGNISETQRIHIQEVRGTETRTIT